MAYNSKYTGAQVEALLDRAGAAPQTYDIGWLLDLYDAGRGTASITEAQFNEVRAAAEAGKVFTGDGTVWRGYVDSSREAENGEVYLEIISAPVGFEWSNAANKNCVKIREIFIYNDGTDSSLTVYGGSMELLPDTILSDYAKTSALPTKTSQLTNDSGFITADDVPTQKKTVVKTHEGTIGYGTSYYAAQPSIELAADKFHIVGRCTGLTLTLPEGADTDGQEYCCQFYVPTASYTLTLPENVCWLNGEAPEFEGGTCCQLVIVNNCAVIGVFKASAE